MVAFALGYLLEQEDNTLLLKKTQSLDTGLEEIEMGQPGSLCLED